MIWMIQQISIYISVSYTHLKEALDWYFAKTSASFCEDYLCMMRNLNQIDLEYAHCRNRSG